MSELNLGRIVPVITLHKVEHALPLADALAEGGIHTMEITLRSEAGLPAIAEIARQRPQMLVGAGTILSEANMRAATGAGARFLVSPGMTEALLVAGKKAGVAYLPGVSTPSEVLLAMQHGYDFLKFFPAEEAGGMPMLKHFASVFGGVRFCPTGGIGPANRKDYLALPNVTCIGGSWLTPAAALQAGDWKAVTKLAQESAA